MIEHSVSPEYSIRWCKWMFGGLTEDGTWGVPRSGLIFHKKGDKLVLTALMPYDPAMPMSEDKLRKEQRGDYDTIKEVFAAAGVEVTGWDEAVNA